jgi:hypothetical protein
VNGKPRILLCLQCSLDFARFIERCHFFVCDEFEIFSEPLRGVSVTASMLSEARI